MMRHSLSTRPQLGLGIAVLIVLCSEMLGRCGAVWDFSGPENCAEIEIQFSNARIIPIKLKDDEQVDLSNIGGADYSQSSLSITKVEEGCQLWSGAGGRGPVNKETEYLAKANTTLEGASFPNYVYCNCPKVCDCNQTQMRRRECGRAYLEEGCDHCDASFTSLAPGEGRREFPAKWKNSVVSIMVRKGCDLTLEVPRSNGTTTTTRNAKTRAGHKTLKIENALGDSNLNLVQSWDEHEAILGYNCECNVTAPVRKVSPSKKAQTNPKYPKLISIPKSREQLLSLLKQKEFNSHPGVIAAVQSLKNKRSPTTAYILVLGLTGSGKSTAVNILFDHPNITTVGGASSTTTDIHEFSIRVRSEELGISNGELHIIDTPGTTDTRGITQDSRFLASLDLFLANHKELSKTLPNIVLIFGKFNDNRYSGDGSTFVKLLRTIELFKGRIIDEKYTNVIFVLTHYMSETKEIMRDPSEKIESIRKVIEQFSTLPKPINIVVAENKPEDTHLPSLNGYFSLPNGELYPKNLFNQIQKTLVTSGDPIGESVIRLGFKNSDNFQILGKRHPLVGEDDPAVTKYMGILSSYDVGPNSTQVSKLLSQVYQNEVVVKPTLKREFPGTLAQLQRSLYQRNIREVNDVPQTTNKILNLMRDIIQNPLSQLLLERALNLTFPVFSSQLVVGCGYDLKQDKVSSPLFGGMDGSEIMSPSAIGFQFPPFYDVHLLNRMQPIFAVFTEREQYSKTRMGNLNLNQGQDSNLESLIDGGGVKNGFNILDESSASTNHLSAVIEYHMFHLKLGKDLQLSGDFHSAVCNLKPLNNTETESVASWQHFFQQYGTHLVTSAYGGGAVTITLRITDIPLEGISSSNSNSTLPWFGILNGAMATVINHLADSFIEDLDSGISNNSTSSLLTLPEGVTVQIKLEGGDEALTEKMEDINLINLAEWKESVHDCPVMLSTYLNLVPVSEVAKLMVVEAEEQHTIASMLEEAASALLNATLVYTPIQRVEGGTNGARDATMNGMEAGIGDFEVVKDFAQILQTMAESSVQMQKTFLTMMAENQKEADRKADLEKEQYRIDKEMRREEEKLRILERESERQAELEKQKNFMDQMAAMEQLRMQRMVNAQEMQRNTALDMQQLRAEQQKMMFDMIQMRNQEMERQEAGQNAAWGRFSDMLGKGLMIAGMAG